MDKNYSFLLEADLDSYTGKWIVIVDGEIVASGLNAEKLYNKVKKKYPNEELLLDRVYGDKTLIV